MFFFKVLLCFHQDIRSVQLVQILDMIICSGNQFGCTLAVEFTLQVSFICPSWSFILPNRSTDLGAKFK